MGILDDLDVRDEAVRQHKSKQFMDYGKKEEAPQQVKPLDPKTAMLLGGLADSISTYHFLKTGNSKESNPLVKKLFNNNPWTVWPVAAATGLGYNALHGYLKKKSPKLADTAAGIIGGTQA